MDELLEWFFSTFSGTYKRHTGIYTSWHWRYEDKDPLKTFDRKKDILLSDRPDHLKDKYLKVIEWYRQCPHILEYKKPSYDTSLDSLSDESEKMESAIPFLDGFDTSIEQLFLSLKKAFDEYEKHVPAPISNPFLVLDGEDEELTMQVMDYVVGSLFHSYQNHATDFIGWGSNRVAVGMMHRYNLVELSKAFKDSYPCLSQLADELIEYDYTETPIHPIDTPLKTASKILKECGVANLFSDFPGKTAIPSKYRYQHQHILAPTGSGKTTLLTMQLQKDLEDCVNGGCSVIVMDTKRDLIKSIERLDSIKDKVISIDAEDSARGYPVALNILDLGKQDCTDPLEKEITRNSNLSMLNYFFNSLMGEGAELTDRQSTVFYYTLELCLEIPNANLDTLLEILEGDGLTKYASYLANLDSDSKNYFDKLFNHPNTLRTRNEIVPRIYGLKRNKSLSRLFSSSETKLDFFSELNAGKVILINCAKSVLRDNVEIFGRFMLAMIMFALDRRQFIAEGKRKPTYIYIDEAHDIIKNDTHLADMLSQVRAYKAGITISHQDWSQINNPKVRSGLEANTIIKMTPHSADYTFNVDCAEIHGTLKTKNISFNDFPQVSDTEYQAILNRNRERFCLSPDAYQVEEEVMEEPPLKVAEKAVQEPEQPDSDDGEDFF